MHSVYEILRTAAAPVKISGQTRLDGGLDAFLVFSMNLLWA